MNVASATDSTLLRKSSMYTSKRRYYIPTTIYINIWNTLVQPEIGKLTNSNRVGATSDLHQQQQEKHQRRQDTEHFTQIVMKPFGDPGIP